MKIKILKATDPAYWYAKYLGSEFEVLKEHQLEYWTRQPDGYLNFVLKKDAQVVGLEINKKENNNVSITIKELQDKIHQANITAGWWTDLSTGQDLAAEARSGSRYGKALVAEKLALIHSEVSEALEGLRKNLMDDKLTHRPMIEVELADTLIRIYDLCGALQLDLDGATAEKLSFNRTREDHQIENRKLENGKVL